MVWTIYPNIGLNDLRFSMSHAEVAALLDPMQAITKTTTLIDGTVNEFRGMSMPVCNYKDGLLRTLDTHWSMAPLLIGDVNLYSLSSKDLLSSLEQRNGGAMEIVWILYFFNIGISASNYLDNRGNILPPLDEDEDDRGIGMFRPGAFDDMHSDARPISFLTP